MLSAAVVIGALRVNLDITENMLKRRSQNSQVIQPLIDRHLFPYMLFSSRSKFPFTGGRNGYGAKLCNIFSKKFIVETSAKDFKKGFRQVSKVVDYERESWG